MKHESRTIGQSRTWAYELCGRLERELGGRLERPARWYEYWHGAIETSRGWPFWRVYGEWRCCHRGLHRRLEEARRIFLDESGQ
ncbi:hypothetical protein [Salmonirosea aquatica]|uniref:Uncharacterized protein n=1 Tax=Salmonirosea aquatica TaxID=2654236 RepID=A0A7C9BI60_9BACT|nr:hypothetical protein [Cytophagaceae bacterium SJW1-29]